MKDILELVCQLYELIPVDPEEITAKELADKLGIGIPRLTSLISTSSAECLIGEYSIGKTKYYTYPDQRCKDKTMRYLRGGGASEIAKESL